MKHTPGPWEYGEGSGTHDSGVEWYVAVEAAEFGKCSPERD